MYYTIYKITRKIDNKIYIGKHKTENLNDWYLGSGKYIKRAVSKHGDSSFTKEIIFMAFSEKDMNWVEENIFVTNEWIDDKTINKFNLKKGGTGGFATNMVTTNTGDYVTKDEFINGDYKGVVYGKIAVVDRSGNTFQVHKTDKRIKSLELVPTFSKNGTISVFDENGNAKRITKEEYATGKYKSVNKGFGTYKDEHGIIHKAKTDDPRVSRGELVGSSAGTSTRKFRYDIFDTNNNIQFSSHRGDFRIFLKENNLPGVLNISLKRNGEPIYKNVYSNKKRLEDSGMLKYKGWYCKKFRLPPHDIAQY